MLGTKVLPRQPPFSENEAHCAVCIGTVIRNSSFSGAMEEIARLGSRICAGWLVGKLQWLTVGGRLIAAVDAASAALPSGADHRQRRGFGDRQATLRNLHVCRSAGHRQRRSQRGPFRSVNKNENRLAKTGRAKSAGGNSGPPELIVDWSAVWIEDTNHVPKAVAVKRGQRDAEARAGNGSKHNIGHERDPGLRRDKKSI